MKCFGFGINQAIFDCCPAQKAIFCNNSVMHSMHGCTWLDGAVIRTLDLRSVDRGSSAIDPGQIVHITHVPLSPSSIIWYTGQREVMFGGREDSCGLGVKRWQPADGFVASRQLRIDCPGS